MAKNLVSGRILRDDNLDGISGLTVVVYDVDSLKLKDALANVPPETFEFLRGNLFDEDGPACNRFRTFVELLLAAIWPALRR